MMKALVRRKSTLHATGKAGKHPKTLEIVFVRADTCADEFT
jgi:hypothetical protein